jgi:uncharacterized protein
MKTTLKRRLRVAAMAAAALTALAALAVAGAGELLSRPASRLVGAAPPDLQARDVHLEADGGSVHGWFVAGPAGGGAVLLLHGVRGDRTSMLERARLLKRAGYSVLLVDLPAHGESGGDRITFGWREAAGVRSALDWLQRVLPAERVGVIGVSLGAAALVYSGARADAAVLESMYPSIEEAVADRLQSRLGAAVGRLAAPLLLWQLPLRLDIDARLLRPVDHIGALNMPLLIASGTADLHTHWAETERIYAAARAPKTLLPVQGAAHVDLQAYDPAAYAGAVLPFLARHLRQAREPMAPPVAPAT